MGWSVVITLHSTQPSETCRTRSIHNVPKTGLNNALYSVKSRGCSTIFVRFVYSESYPVSLASRNGGAILVFLESDLVEGDTLKAGDFLVDR